MRARERARVYVNRLQTKTHSLTCCCVVEQSRRREGYTIRFLKRTLLAHSPLDERLLHCMLQAQGQLSHSHPIQGEPSWAWTQAGWPLNPPLLTSIVLSIGFTEPVRPTIQARAHHKRESTLLRREKAHYPSSTPPTPERGRTQAGTMFVEERRTHMLLCCRTRGT